MSVSSAILSAEETGLVEELAGRLKLVQADAVEASPQQRQEYLREEIERGLKKVATPRRKAVLDNLLARFAVEGEILQSGAPAEPAARPAPETFEQLLERFLGAAKQLPEAQRTALLEKLKKEGLGPPADVSPECKLSAEQQKALGLSPGAQVRPDRLIELCVRLAAAFQQVDQAALGTMRELNARSPLAKRPMEFRQAVELFLAGGEAPLEPQIRATSGLLGALLAAILGGGKDFGRLYVERLSPSAIEDVVTGEGSSSILGLGKNKKERCWEKYALLSREYETPELVNRRIRDCLATFVETKVLSGR